MTSRTLEIGFNISSVNNEQTRGGLVTINWNSNQDRKRNTQDKTESNQDTLPEKAIRLMVKRQSERIS